MPRVANPEAGVIKFFQTTPIEVAQSVYNIVGQLLRERAPAKQTRAPRKKKEPSLGGNGDPA